MKKLLQFFENLQDQVKIYFQNEVEILRLRALALIASALSRAFAVVFLIISFNITLVLVGLWLGFWLSSLLGSYSLGFGLAAGLFILFLLILIVFHRALLVRPFENLVIRFYEQSRDEATKSTPSKTDTHEG